MESSWSRRLVACSPSRWIMARVGKKQLGSWTWKMAKVRSPTTQVRTSYTISYSVFIRTEAFFYSPVLILSNWVSFLGWFTEACSFYSIRPPLIRVRGAQLFPIGCLELSLCHERISRTFSFHRDRCYYCFCCPHISLALRSLKNSQWLFDSTLKPPMWSQYCPWTLCKKHLQLCPDRHVH